MLKRVLDAAGELLGATDLRERAGGVLEREAAARVAAVRHGE